MNWENWLFVSLLALIVLAQATALVGLVRRGVATDRGSAWALVLAWQAVLLVSGYEALWLGGLWQEPRWVGGLGVAAFAAGFWLRLVAVATLARQFSPLVELQEGHELITHGPYAWVRHPAYLGSLMWAIAPPLLLGSAMGLVALVCCYYPALRYRVAVEERLLAGQFGDAWDDYRSRVPALIPRPARRPVS